MDERLCFPYMDQKENIPEFANDITQIYNKMMDSVSKDIFVNRLLFSLTGDHAYLKNVLMYTSGGKKLNTILKENEKVYIYGAGIRGKRLVKLFPDKNWNGIIDIKSCMESYHGVKIVNLDQFMDVYTRGTAIIVSNMKETEVIVSDLLERQIFPEDIFVLNHLEQENAEGMYFASECIGQAVDSEKGFVDIGCYDGKDSLKYLEWCNKNDAVVYAFEPDINNYKVCKKNLNGYPNVKLFNIGLSNVVENVAVMGEGEMSYLAKANEQVVQTRLLDDVIQNQNIGFIKMDVEGYEENVLKGSRQIISREHPVMAISVYHKKSDIWRISKLLLEYYKDYCFYMRHYSATNGDTVLYAIDTKR